MPYGCANEKMLAVMYVLDGEVMFNELSPCSERSSRYRNQVYKSSRVRCHDQQQIHLHYPLEPRLRSPLVHEKVMVLWKDMPTLIFHYQWQVLKTGNPSSVFTRKGVLKSGRVSKPKMTYIIITRLSDASNQL